MESKTRSAPKTWETWEGTFPEPEPTTGIVVGLRSLSNGRSIDYGYEEGSIWINEKRIRAYLIAYDVHKAPVYVLPEHVKPELTRGDHR